jgi:hypothetical protein
MGVGTRVASFESRESDEAARRAWLLVLARSKGILGHHDHERSGASKKVRGGTSDETLTGVKKRSELLKQKTSLGSSTSSRVSGARRLVSGPLETPNLRLEPRTPGSIRARVF